MQFKGDDMEAIMIAGVAVVAVGGYYSALDLLAEDLRQAQNFLSEITGQFTPDDLLGEIFSKFCIGK